MQGISSPRFVATTSLTFPHIPYLIECWVNFLKVVVNLISALTYLKDTLPSVTKADGLQQHYFIGAPRELIRKRTLEDVMWGVV